MFRNATYLFNYLLNIHLYDNKFWNIPIFSVLAFWNFKYIIMAAYKTIMRTGSIFNTKSEIFRYSCIMATHRLNSAN